ncbi:hypothetical protein GH714_038436 [Hevea brasiliensis]|uniref:Peptidase A1 domain-containing protein n=1 Tax=Hevea brasiliensis TaxID=3981 RepID=A0A6A6MTF5_HEVBR|nr:hypothetical protein GH714_038436 [Hevea brasiliensis]
MEGKAKNALLLFSFAIFLSLSTTSSTPLHYQILVLNPLPSQPTISWPTSDVDPDSDSETLPASVATETESTLSIQLHHIDALSLNKTPQELFSLRLNRDASRVKALSSLAASAAAAAGGSVTGGFSSSVISGLAQGSGEYFTRIGVGTPPRYVYMVLDTGSDVVWIQCAPCKKCYSQSDPVFDPRQSRSFVGIPCGSPLCNRLDSPVCNTQKQTCMYQVSYGDGSFTLGDFSTETLTFRRSRVGRVALGCGHDNEGLFVGAAGLLGLGRGRLSFPSQTGRRFNRKFSYCLVDRSASSKPSSVVFGDSAISRTARFTPLISNPKLDTFYYVELLGISVGGTRVPGITASLFKLDRTGNGGVIIDSGTSVTRLTRPAYIALRDAFRVRATNLNTRFLSIRHVF